MLILTRLCMIATFFLSEHLSRDYILIITYQVYSIFNIDGVGATPNMHISAKLLWVYMIAGRIINLFCLYRNNNNNLNTLHTSTSKNKKKNVSKILIIVNK